MTQKPNFIIIHTDQQRDDCVGVAGRRTGIYTPYIDSIAYQGANFTNCYASCPLCIPQRLSLLTGQTPSHHGLFSNTGIPYLPLETTLPTEMRRGGYETALVGRTMHTYPFHFSYGFEYYLPGDPSSEFKESTDACSHFCEKTVPGKPAVTMEEAPITIPGPQDHFICRTNFIKQSGLPTGQSIFWTAGTRHGHLCCL